MNSMEKVSVPMLLVAVVVLGGVVMFVAGSGVGANSQFAAAKAAQSAKSANKGAVITVDDDGAQCSAEYTTITDAVAAASDGDTIRLCAGEYSGVLLNKSLHFKGQGLASITGGPAHPAGLSQGFRLAAGASGSSFSHLTFEVDLAIINGDAVDNITVEHNTFNNAIQAVSNWRGAGWAISYNKIIDLRTRCGGGIGILIGDYANMDKTTGNVVSHNDILGEIHVSAGDCGGYDGSGIVLYSDHRFGRIGGSIFGNNITKNKIDLQSDTPELVDVVAFELTDTRDSLTLSDVFDNAIGFNDFRDTVLQLAFTPENLDVINTISRNLGDNRGHGVHPSAFHP